MMSHQLWALCHFLGIVERLGSKGYVYKIGRGGAPAALANSDAIATWAQAVRKAVQMVLDNFAAAQSELSFLGQEEQEATSSEEAS